MIFSPGQEEATIRVSTFYDTVVEDRETFTIVLSTNDLNTEVDSAVTVNIIDNDGIEIFGTTRFILFLYHCSANRSDSQYPYCERKWWTCHIEIGPRGNSRQGDCCKSNTHICISYWYAYNSFAIFITLSKQVDQIFYLH